MNPRTITLIGILGGALGVLAWDVSLTLNAEDGDTVSSVLNQHSMWAGPTAGYICGHLFSKSVERGAPSSLKFGGGAFALLLGFGLGDGFLGFLFGVLLGAVCWPNLGRKGP